MTFRKLWFSVFVATYVSIKSKVLDTGLWDFYHLFFVILRIFLGMESTLVKKITIIFFFHILGYFYLFYLSLFFQSFYLFFHTQKVATQCEEKNNRIIMTIGYKSKKFLKVKKCQKMPKKLNIFNLKIHCKNIGKFSYYVLGNFS